MAVSASDTLAALPWNEKHRPRTLDDVADQEEVVQALQKTKATGQLPHMLFFGPAGTGKTTTALALVRDLFGTATDRRVLELNASDDRGIAAVREKIKSFAKVAISRKDPKAPCPPFKVIILDEADSMTADAQSALRRMMEEFVKSTRFILCCNYVSRIISPLHSRCNKFRFQPLGSVGLSNRLRTICAKENVVAEDAAIDTLVRASRGDCRRSVGYLQTAYQALPEPEAGPRVLTAAAVAEVAVWVPSHWIERFVSAPLARAQQDAEGGSANENLRAQAAAEHEESWRELLLQGFSPEAIFLQVKDALLERDWGLSDFQLAKIALSLAEIDGLYLKGAPAAALIPQLSSLLHQYAFAGADREAEEALHAKWLADGDAEYHRNPGRLLC